jgi:hypothetical protein
MCDARRPREQVTPSRGPSRMPFASSLLRALAPGVQVPLANACACSGVAALVMHAGRTSSLRKEAFSVGLAVASLASLVAMRSLFTRTRDPHAARVRAFLWLPLAGAIVGWAADVSMRMDGCSVGLSIAGNGDLTGGGLETVVIATLSAFVGLLGTALVLPQIHALERARSATKEQGARLAALAERLALFTWSVALGIGVIANDLARPREIDATRALVIVGTLGIIGQCGRALGVRAAVAPMTRLPYR